MRSGKFISLGLAGLLGLTTIPSLEGCSRTNNDHAIKTMELIEDPNLKNNNSFDWSPNDYEEELIELPKDNSNENPINEVNNLEKEKIQISSWNNIEDQMNISIKTIIRDAEAALNKYEFYFDLSDYTNDSIEDIKAIEKNIVQPPFLKDNIFSYMKLSISNPEEFIGEKRKIKLEDSLNNMFFRIDEKYFKDNFVSYANLIDSLNFEYENPDWLSLLGWTIIKDKDKALKICSDTTRILDYVLENHPDIETKEKIKKNIIANTLLGNYDLVKEQNEKLERALSENEFRYILEQKFKDKLLPRISAYYEINKPDMEKSKRVEYITKFSTELVKVLAISNSYKSIKQSIEK